MVPGERALHGTCGGGAAFLSDSDRIGADLRVRQHALETCRRHAAANLMPVVAANRIGEETVEPCEENGGQRSALVFYGSSFLTDETGEILTGAGRDEEEILVQEYDLDELDARRLEWGLFRDRRRSATASSAAGKRNILLTWKQ